MRIIELYMGKKHLIIGLFYVSFFFQINAQYNDSAWVVNNYNKSEILISARDGIKLFLCAKG
jgi:hypothetical protein